MEGLMLHRGAEKLGRQDLLALPSPDSTDTHTVLPHSQFVAQTLEALAYRRIEVVKDEYGVSKDGMRMFGAMTLSLGEDADRPDRVNLVLGLRNSHDKTFSLGMVAGFRVFVCDNLSFQGDFFALARKHSKKLMDGFVDSVAIGVDRVQRHFLPMQQRVDVWRNHTLPDIEARELIYKAFIEEAVDVPKHLAKAVHRHYFEPPHPAFEPRTLWSLQNSFTEAFKALEPVPQFRATASLGEYFAGIN
jgi:hypothetical protein